MRFPLFFVATAYAAGLAVLLGVDDSPLVLLALTGVALLLGILMLRRGWRRAGVACALTGFFLLGGATIRLEELSIPATRIDRIAAAGRLNLNQAVRVRGWLQRDPTRRHGLFYLPVELESVEQGGTTFAASGGVRVAFNPGNDLAFGDTLPPLRYGDRIEMLLLLRPPVRYQNLGSFDWRAYWSRQGIYFDGALPSALLLEKLPDRKGNPLIRETQRLRAWLLNRLDALIPPGEARAVLHAMLLGDRGALDDSLRNDFRLSGAYHVLVISGLHIGVLAFFLFWLFRTAGASDWLITLATIATLILYLLIVEDRPPTERAVWMVSLYLLSRLVFRDVHLANPAGLAALLVLFVHPTWLFDTSFHFTFGAVFLIAFLGAPWIERHAEPWLRATYNLDSEVRDDFVLTPALAQFRLDLRQVASLLAPYVFWTKEPEFAAQTLLAGLVRVVLRAWELFLLSFAIHLGLLLLIANSFQQMVWTGLLANMMVLPLVGIIVPLGFLTLAVPFAGKYLAVATVWPVNLLLALVEGLAALPLNYRLPPPPPWLLILYLSALVLLALAVNYRRGQRWALLLLVPLLLLVSAHPFPPDLPPRTLEITVLDVGQGDAIFIAFPNGKTWLLDGGPGLREIPVAQGAPAIRVGYNIGSNVVGAYLRARGIRKLDRVWLSHAHLDHTAGLEAVLKEFPVGSLHVGWPTPPRNPPLLHWASARGVPVVKHHAGETIPVDDVRVEILWPALDYTPGDTSQNNDSLVLRLCRFAHCVLLPGDIEPELERQLAAGKRVLSAGALKVPHHGGTGAATTEFLAAVRPEVAVISVGGRNPHGHPRDGALARLEESAADVFRTDFDGSVTLRITARGISVRRFQQGEPAAPYPNALTKLANCFRRWSRLE